MQSKDYVPGVSGFKVDLTTGQVEINEGTLRIKATASMITFAGPGQSNDQAADNIRDAVNDQERQAAQDTAKPFIVEPGHFFINGAVVDDSAIAAKIAHDYRLLVLQAKNGESYVAGFGVGLASEGKCAAQAVSKLTTRVTGEDKPDDSALSKALEEREAGMILKHLAARISQTSLAESLKRQINPFHEVVRSVIREELRPGGLLHRSR